MILSLLIQTKNLINNINILINIDNIKKKIFVSFI
jgi:hypothetical protein